MEILRVTLPEVIRNFTKWYLLCNLPLEGPWKQKGVAVWGAGNCILVATACKDSTATELELSPYQDYPPDPNASNVWNTLLARCVQAGWISDFEPIGVLDYDKRRTMDSFCAISIAASKADPSGYASRWKKECLEENYLDWEAEHKTQAEINQEIEWAWGRHLTDMAQFQSSIEERASHTYKTAKEAAHRLLECLEDIDTEYWVDRANSAYAQRPVTNTTESETTNTRDDLARDSIIQWLREGNEHEAANLLAECSISIEGVDVAFAMIGDGEIEICDAQIAAPRRVFEIVDNKPSPLAEQIDRAIREYAKSNNFYIQNVTWVSQFSDAKTTIHPTPTATGTVDTAQSTASAALGKGQDKEESARSTPTEECQIKLRRILDKRFNKGELRGLCFDMHIDFEELAGEGKPEKVIALIEFCERRGRISELESKVYALRPNASLEDMPE